MEKTTKKQPGDKDKKEKKPLKYGTTKQADVDELFHGAAMENAGIQLAPLSERLQECESLGGVYALQETIPTIVGPIGKFPMVPEALPLHPAIVGFGKRRTGKTHSARWLFYKCLQHIPFGIVITRTKVNGFWQTYVPPLFVFEAEAMTHSINTLLHRQRTLIAKWKKDNPEKAAESPDAYKSEPSLAAFCILDDIIADAAAMIWNTQLTSLFVEGRHVCITVCILSQYPKGVGPKIRGNADIVILQPIYDADQVDMVASMYNGGLDKQTWKVLMNQIVQDNLEEGSTPLESKKNVRTMVVCDFENTKNPQIKFKWSSSEDPGPFRLCDPEYWKPSYQMMQQSKVVEELDPVEELESIRF